VIKVLIVDDHPFIRETLAELFASTQDICVVAQCADGGEVLATALRTDPDVVLMDLTMPRMTGLEAARELLAARPDVRVVMLTATVTSTSVREAQEVGAAGYLVKGENPGDLPKVVRTVAAGDSVWSPSAVAHLPRN
jgi:DNA-binding NarL/FixJ family response regulator